MNIKFDHQNSFVEEREVENIKEFVKTSHDYLHKKTGKGKEYLGWVDLPENIKEDEILDIKEVAKKIQDSSDALVVIGIGGSYLGARACIEALTPNFYNNLSKEDRKTPEIYYVGNNLSSDYISDLLKVLKDKDISINVISKSGTTTEPAIAFRILRDYMEEKYTKEEIRERIYITTDSERGALKELAIDEGYKTFVIPDDVGGRYSIFTPVGLLPIAVAGIDIDKLLEGANSGREEYSNVNIEENPAYKYAAIRNILYNRGKDIEILVNYEPNLKYLSEWWKQLFGESEGKDNKGIYPSSVNFTTDLHSLGQIIQDGKRNIFETNIIVEESKEDIVLKKNEDDLDDLNYLEGKTLNLVNQKAFQGTLKAHVTGGVPNLIFTIPRLDEFYFGKLTYMFEKACGISGYLLGVNPFNQPGVEEYKKNMFQLLGKPGY